MAAQEGLEWIDGLFGPEPAWTIEPSVEKIEIIARKQLQIGSNDRCQVRFHGKGCFNKLYRIETTNGDFIMRVSLPVDPHNKTSSEVATIAFVRQNTSIPVPEVLAFDDSQNNELGFEWILMELVPGNALYKVWRKLSDDAKGTFVKQIAEYQAQLYSYQFSTIGSIISEPTDSPGVISTTGQTSQPIQQALPILGKVVSQVFFWDNRTTQTVFRGPFNTTERWLSARLSLILADQENIIKSSADEGEVEDAENATRIITRLFDLLPTIFPSGLKEKTALFHDDLSLFNILVDNDGKITGVMD